jgi:hypothetical protein
VATGDPIRRSALPGRPRLSCRRRSRTLPDVWSDLIACSGGCRRRRRPHRVRVDGRPDPSIRRLQPVAPIPDLMHHDKSTGCCTSDSGGDTADESRYRRTAICVSRSNRGAKGTVEYEDRTAKPDQNDSDPVYTCLLEHISILPGTCQNIRPSGYEKGRATRARFGARSGWDHQRRLATLSDRPRRPIPSLGAASGIAPSWRP